MVRSYRKEALPSVYNVEDIPEWDVTEHSSMQVLRGQNLMVGFSTLGPDLDELSPYSHPWEQITMVTQGSCELLVGEQVTSVSEGDVFAVPPAVEHGVRVTSDTDCKLIDFWPLVERYLDYTAYQNEFVTTE